MSNINICKNEYNELINPIHDIIVRTLINNKSYFLKINEPKSVFYSIENVDSTDFNYFTDKDDVNENIIMRNNLLNRYLIDIALYHLKRLNIDDINNYHIEFKLHDTESSHSFNINETDTKPTLCCILFLNTNKSTPFVFTNIDSESYKYKNFEDNNQIIICYPDSTNIISYENTCYSGYINTNKRSMLSKETKFLELKLWYKPLQNKEECLNLNNKGFEMYKDIHEPFLFKDITNEIYPIKLNSCVTSFEYFNDFLYNKHFYHFYKLHRILRNQYGNLFSYNLNEKDNVNSKQVIEDINTIRKNNSSNHNRFLQRYTFKNIMDSTMSNKIVEHIQKSYSDLSTFPDDGIIFNDSTTIFKDCLSFIIPVLHNIKKIYNLQNLKININNLYLMKRSHKFYHIPNINKSLLSIFIHINHSISTEGEYFFQDGLTNTLNKGDAIVFSNINTDYTILPITKGSIYILCYDFDINE